MRCLVPLLLLLLFACRVCGAEALSTSECLHGCTASMPVRACVAATHPPPAETDAWLLLAAMAVCAAGRLATSRRG